MATEFVEGTQRMVGGTSAAFKATDEVQQYVDQVKSEVERKTQKNFDEFTAVSYKSQVVAGVNYFVKVRVGPNDFIHLRIFVRLPHVGGLELSGYRENMTKDAEIEYF